ncbi:MAG: acyl carrier protein [Nannocystaceae bacterium]|nr:acyl carrier protein [Nannocystaceae bacterium]
MSEPKTFVDVRNMMAEVFELAPERITMDARLYEDLELDSIDALDMVVKLQEIIHRRVEEPELRALKTVADVVAMVDAARSPGTVVPLVPESRGTGSGR